YREAYIDYDYNHLDEAEALFLEVVQEHTTHELAPFAANLFLDALNAQGKTHDVARWVRAFMEMPPLMADRTFAAQMVTLLSDVYELEARESETRGDAKECGRSFVSAAEAQPEHPKHAERLWNAAQCFQNAHLVGRAINAWKALIDQHPADALAK